MCVRETGNVSDDRRLKATVTSVPKRGLQLECGKSHHAMFPEEGLRRREESSVGLGREGAWFNLGTRCCGSRAEPWPSGCEVLDAILSPGK